jgi:hypothetical protein
VSAISRFYQVQYISELKRKCMGVPKNFELKLTKEKKLKIEKVLLTNFTKKLLTLQTLINETIENNFNINCETCCASGKYLIL